MATEHAHENGPLHDGEFQRIAGIGPGIAQRLHAAGIQTFRELAAMAPEEIYAQLNGLVGMTSERIAHQDWPGQAEQLSREIASVVPSSELEEPGERQHYASFMIELLQDENHTVRRTRVMHVQNGEKDSWASWDVGRIVRWITNQAAITSPVDTTIAESRRKPLAQIMALELGEIDLFLSSGETSNRFLVEGQSFTVNLPIKIKTTNLLSMPLRYRAAVQARPITGQRSQTAETTGLLDPQTDCVLNISVEGLAEGAYRLETNLLVYSEDITEPEKDGIYAFSEGGLVYVFSRETETVA